MKTNPLLTSLAAVGATLAFAVPTALSQNAERSDTSGTLLTPLSLGSAQIVGKLSPDHLGSGTPTSSTVLRGDGTWVGTTPTGATIPAMSSLLMGDGAGNAVGTGSCTDLFRVLQTRLQALQASESVPVNLLLAPYLPFAGTVNPDGTLTVPANGSLQWYLYGDAGNLPLYAYMVATTEQPAGALVCDRDDGYDRPSTDSTVAPGAYRSTFLSSNAYAYPIIVKNTTAAPITIFFPVLSYQDTGLALLASHADFTAVSTQPVADLDFSRFSDADRSARYQLEKGSTLAADSVNGNNANAGSLYAPKVTLQQTITNPGGVFGLYRGSLFRDSLPLSTLGTTHGVVVQDVALGSVKPLPIISALDPVNLGAITPNGDSTFSYLWTPAEGITSDGYSNVYAVEINTATEAGAPVASRRRMTDVMYEASMPTGSAWVLPPGTGSGQSGSATQWKVILRPSDNLAPGSGSYRYEVVSRVAPANWGSFATNVGDGSMSGLELVGASSGYGSLSGPRGFVGDRLVILHATTHNAVINGGSLQRSVFYESGTTTQTGSGPGIQLAWYADIGTGLRWDTRHCLFYMNVGDRYANGIISHTSQANTSTFDRGDISDCAFLGARWSTGALEGDAIAYVNVAAGTVNRAYVQSIKNAFSIDITTALEVKNSVFRGVHTALGGTNFHDNVAQVVNGGDPNDNNNRNPVCVYFRQNGTSVTNDLFWAHTETATGLGNDSQVSGVSFASGSLTNCTCSRNILVLDPANQGAPSTYMVQVANQGSQHIDYNLVINLGKAGISAEGNYAGWTAYQAGYPTQDQHSMYVDLSLDPRGLRAVFADPTNGDFRWAQTEVARQCAAYCKTNGVGPAAVTSRWPLVPTVDEAVRLLTDL